MPTLPMSLAGFEVKFFLTPAAVLNADGTPTAEAVAAFGITGGPEGYRVAFFDTPLLDFHTERWNVRFRDKGGKVELSYKRRLPVYREPVGSVLATALRQGFDKEEQDKKYKAEIEWGLGEELTDGPAKRTLSITKKFDDDIEWPTTPDQARAAVKKTLPGKLDNWLRPGWVEAVVADGVMYGPVAAHEWKWSAADAGDDTAFEVWTVKGKLVVEVSFKMKHEADAAAARGRLLSLVRTRPGWLTADELKTDLVLMRYAG